MRIIMTLLLGLSLSLPANAQLYTGTPEAPTAPAAPTQAEVPASPVLEDAVSPEWPADTREIFINSCIQLKRQLIPACRCIINELMQVMGHDEFLKLAEADLIEKDQRYLSIRSNCIASPGNR